MFGNQSGEVTQKRRKSYIYRDKLHFRSSTGPRSFVFPKVQRPLKTDAFGAVEMNSILAPFICQRLSTLH
jgi:hypothetical protein